MPALFAQVAQIEFLLPDEAASHGGLHEFSDRAVKGSRACRAKAQAMEVLVGGVPIGVLSREDIGKSIGYVLQTPFVFSGTVRDNIAYGCGEVTLEQVRHAAQQAHVHADILEMPQGYDTMLNERGANLSGGRRQRVSLARMFLKNPPVLILSLASLASIAAMRSSSPSTPQQSAARVQTTQIRCQKKRLARRKEWTCFQ